MILIYRVLTNLIYPLLILLIFFRKIIKKEDSLRYKEKIFISNFNVTRKSNSKLIWFHAASIGEFKSILPVISELNKNDNNLEFLITTITLSSSNLAKDELKKYSNVYHRFFPVDVGFIIEKFLITWKPYAIFLVDSEIWPNLIFKADKYKIPMAIINARITSKTFKRWMMIPNTAKKVFSFFKLCLASNLETKNYLLKLNVKKVFYTGNIKLFNTIDERSSCIQYQNILSKKKFWLGASTHEGEEKFCLHTHLNLKTKYKEIMTIIAPRHINRVKNIKKLCESFNLKTQIIKKNDAILDNKEIIIINSFGVLQDFFKYAKCVFIGKSTIKRLKNVGGQNPIDAAKHNCRIYHGPYVYNFAEIYEILEKNNISKKVESSVELSENIAKDLAKPKEIHAKISIFINNLGQKILADTMKNINNFLSNENK